MRKYKGKKICIICEGYEELDYIETLKAKAVFSDKYDFVTVNAKSINTIISRYQEKYQSATYSLVLIFCDTDKGPSEKYKEIKQKINDFHGEDVADDIIIFGNPCTMQIIISHFADVKLKSQSKAINSKYIKEYVGIEDYLKVIQNILFLEKDRMFLAGEPREIDIEKGFVIDLTSIIILALIGKLDVFTPELSEKVYITTSLKNKINYSYELLLKKQGKKEMTIGLYKQEDGSKKLAKNEIEINKEINFFKEIYKCINRFNVEDVEAVKDDILNEKSRNVLDKVQFDLMTLAKQKGLPFICDDLVIRILAEFNYKIEHTNCISLIEYFHRENFDKYIDTISDFVEYNYTYAVYSGKYIGNIFAYLYSNCNDEIKKKVENIVKKLLRNKKSFDMYISDLINIINNSKRVQYTVILDRAYKNEKMTYIIDMLVENIKIACDNLGLDYNEYEKYITKESGGIEFIDDNN